MNNQIPFFNPFNNYPPPNFIDNNDLEKLKNKIERLEKNIRILENRVHKLEHYESPKTIINNEEPTDMYII